MRDDIKSNGTRVVERNTHGQPRLRLVVVNAEPRKCAQSTSERSSSQVTWPPDSRSISIASDSPQGRSPYAMLRRWPQVVPHRSANAARSESFMGERNAFSSMGTDYHHTMIINAIPFEEFTERCLPSDNVPMGKQVDQVLHALWRVRRENLQKAVERYYGGNQTVAAVDCGLAQNRFNPVLNGKKPFHERTAIQIELGMGLLPGQLSQPDSPLLRDASRGDKILERAMAEVRDLEPDELATLLADVAKIRGRRQRKKTA